jgi:RimJ/RimL family protein N-acetyltransferase
MSGAGFTRLESERLILRRFADSDLVPFLAYRNDPEVARYQDWESCTEQEATTMIEELKSLQPGTPGEWFQFAIELKETGALIGDCALKVEQDGRQAEIGFSLSREHQGKGYASEAVSRLLDYAFGDLGLHRVVAITDQENEPSFALLERLGMRREGCFVQNAWFKGRWVSEYLYAVLADEWFRRKPWRSTVKGEPKMAGRRHRSCIEPTDDWSHG